MDKTYLRRVGLGLLSILLTLLLILYLLYHAFSGLGTNVETTLVGLSTAERTVALDGYVFRDGRVLTSDYTGTKSYAVSSGEKVAAGSVLATVYPDETNADRIAQITALSERLAMLESASNGKNRPSAQIDRQISEILLSMKAHILDGDLSFAISGESELLLALCERELSQSSDSSFSGLIASLAATLSSLRASLVGSGRTILSPSDGYFYSTYDGAQAMFSTDRLATLTPSSLDALVLQAQRSAPALPGGAIGALVDTYSWSVAANVDARTAEAFTAGHTYPVIFPQNADARLSGRLEKIVHEAGSGKSLLIFSFSEIAEGFDFSVAQSIRVVTGTVSGFAIPAAAMHYEQGHSCVYILRGGMVYLRAVKILDRFDGYYYVSAASEGFTVGEGDDEVTYLGLRENEYVIIYGRKLSHHKVVS